jgi:hypothetical protein
LKNAGLVLDRARVRVPSTICILDEYRQLLPANGIAAATPALWHKEAFK